MSTLRISNSDGRVVELLGRNAWALNELLQAGNAGCTSFDNPGPRWSAYVHNLRHKHGLDIETIHESHSGPFPGTHARYVLRTNIRVVSGRRARA